MDKIESSPPQEETEAVPVAADLQDLDAKIRSMMEHTGKSIFSSVNNPAVMLCKLCGKDGQMANIKNHIEANHITGVSHTCDICGKICKTRNSLNVHKSTDHRKQR